MAERRGLPRSTVTLGLGLLAVLLGITLIYLQAASVRRLNLEKQQEQQALVETQAYLNRLQDLRDQAPLYRERLSLFQEMIPGAAGEEALLRHIHELAGDCDLRVIEVRFEEREQVTPYMIMPLVITLEGRYEGILQILYMFRYGKRTLRVDYLDISSARSAASGNKLTVYANAFYSLGE
ncbi:MAG: type 4a pilus biogenesis protein PilO [Bacillota bacterium]